jgi:hypothetical protein
VMAKTSKVRILTSIASSEGWSYQNNQVAQVDSALAAKWVRSGIAESVSASTPVTSFDQLDALRDLSAEEAMRRACEHCQKRRAQTVIQNRALCGRCAKAEWGI